LYKVFLADRSYRRQSHLPKSSVRTLVTNKTFGCCVSVHIFFFVMFGVAVPQHSTKSFMWWQRGNKSVSL